MMKQFTEEELNRLDYHIIVLNVTDSFNDSREKNEGEGNVLAYTQRAWPASIEFDVAPEDQVILACVSNYKEKRRDIIGVYQLPRGEKDGQRWVERWKKSDEPENRMCFVGMEASKELHDLFYQKALFPAKQGDGRSVHFHGKYKQNNSNNIDN